MRKRSKVVLGIDVGATGIKGALVDVKKGEMITERIKYPTPKPATPRQVFKVIQRIVEDLEWKDKTIGIGFPAIIKHGVSHSAANIDDKFLGYNIERSLKKKLSKKLVVLNDADAAGIASMTYGVGKRNQKKDVIILLTLGTGIGSAVFLHGRLLPNTELGHLKFRNSVAEKYASNSAREAKHESYETWAKDLDEVLKYYDFIFSPDLFIISGGVSKKYDRYEEYLSLKDKIVPAQLLNNAGIVGAACAAYKLFGN
jgi:polyphosphate glucokinase